VSSNVASVRQRIGISAPLMDAPLGSSKSRGAQGSGSSSSSSSWSIAMNGATPPRCCACRAGVPSAACGAGGASSSSQPPAMGAPSPPKSSSYSAAACCAACCSASGCTYCRCSSSRLASRGSSRSAPVKWTAHDATCVGHHPSAGYPSQRTPRASACVVCPAAV
jgi:hypothetical protein